MPQPQPQARAGARGAGLEYYCEAASTNTILKENDAYALTGDLGASGGTLKVDNLNGTFKAATMDFGSLYYGPNGEQQRNISMSAIATSGGKHQKFNGYAIYNGDEDAAQIRFTLPNQQEALAIWVSPI